jgi:hypothetical protein
MPPDERPRRVQAIHLSRRRQAERIALADWARLRSDAASVFIIDDIEFRMRSRRSIVTAREDVRYVYYLAPHMLDEWMVIEGQQQTLLRPTAPLQDLQKFQAWANELAASPGSIFSDVPNWYVVLPAEIAPQHPGGAEEIATDRWGEHYRLYRLP